MQSRTLEFRPAVYKAVNFYHDNRISGQVLLRQPLSRGFLLVQRRLGWFSQGNAYLPTSRRAGPSWGIRPACSSFFSPRCGSASHTTECARFSSSIWSTTCLCIPKSCRGCSGLASLKEGSRRSSGRSPHNRSPRKYMGSIPRSFT